MEVNIHEAKTHLSRLLERVAMGEEVIIAKAGTPVAKLVPLTDAPEEASMFGIGKRGIVGAGRFQRSAAQGDRGSLLRMKTILDTTHSYGQSRRKESSLARAQQI